MIGRNQAEPWWLSWAGERRIKDSYQFSLVSFRLKSPPAKSLIKGYFSISSTWHLRKLRNYFNDNAARSISGKSRERQSGPMATR